MRNAVIFLVCLGGLLALSRISLHLIGTENIGVDDANIFFVYAKNLAEGHGFVYNAGGERVEGYSSMLWTLILAGVFSITSKPEPVILFLNLIFGAVTLTALTSFFRDWMERRTGNSTQPLLGFGGLFLLAWALTSPGFVVWTMITLMENGLWTMVAVLGTLSMLEHARPEAQTMRDRAKFALLLSLVILSRPEGMLWAAVLGVGAFIARWVQGGGFVRSFGEVALPAGACVLTVAGLFIFRMTYFGYPFPNTYYAKVSPDKVYNLVEGSKYLARFQLSNWLVPVFTLIALLGGWKLVRCVFPQFRPAALDSRKVSTSDLSVGLLSLVLLVGGIIPVLVGGDHFVLFRFYQVIWPILPLPVLMLAGPMLSERINLPTNWRVMLPILTTALLIFFPRDAWYRLNPQHSIRSEFNIVKRDRELGELLNRTFAATERPSVGVVAAGAIALAYDGEVIDMMGLNNSVMAQSEGDRKGRKNHAAFSKDVLLEQRPDILTPYTVNSVEKLSADHRAQQSRLRESPSEDVLKGLRSEARFLKLYQLGALQTTDGQLIGGWFHKDYLKTSNALKFHLVN